MTTISSLPEEILEEIFRFIESNVQLAQCRLVCSKWNHPANSAMFSNTIVLKTKEKAMTLYAQLFSDPSKGELIRHLYIDENFDSFWMLKTMFRTDSMPNLESFKGDFSSEAFYGTFLDIIKDAPTKFNKLRVLPRYEGTVTQEYCDAMCACSSTLLEIGIDNEKTYLNDTIKAFALKLESFGNLKTLSYWGKFHEVSEIELLLQGCIHLKDMTLGALVDGEAMKKHDLAAWMQAEVKQVNSVEELTIEPELRCDVVEYLVYKYPNLKEIQLSTDYPETLYTENMTKFKNNMDRIFQSIEDIPNKKMTLWLHSNNNFYQIVDYFIKKGCQLKIKENEEPNYIQVEIEGL